ncbi:MAG TPA: polysaccharide deacetylase family protein [Solirubrobacterales bacterium]|jgi:peptidoglycan/xylan/chitin deacetylase (PgdA/CDA1 family)
MGVTVVCYHGVSPTWPAETTVTPDSLERQLEWFAKRGYRSSTLSEALGGPSGDERVLAITFDDAHRSVLEAEPLLTRHGFVATVYAPTSYVDSGELMGWEGYDIWLDTPHEGELAPMSWDELGGLRERGWEIGSHTHTHPKLTEVDDGRLAAELEESRARCVERLGIEAPTLAYPYGLHDRRVRQAAADAGYTVAVSLPQKPTAPLPLAWPRIGVFHDDTTRRLALRSWRYSRLAESGFASRALERALAMRRS